MYYRGIPVEGMYYTFHYKKGELQSANGDYVSTQPANTKANISEKDAFETVLNNVNAKTYNWETEKTERPKGQLVYFYKDSSLILCYKYDMRQFSASMFLHIV